MSFRLSAVPRSNSRAREQARARSRRRRLWALEGLEARVLLSGNPTYYTVNLTSDSGTSSGTDAYPTAGTPSGDLLWAITQANANTNTAGSIIDFDPTVIATPETITLSSTLVLSESAGPEVIDGPSSGVVISGNNAVEVFQVDGGVTGTLAGLTISGGLAGYFGGGIDNGGALTITGSNITENSCTGNGDGISNSGTLTVIDSTIEGNSGGLYGGGICSSGTVTVIGSTIQGNSAAYEGGGIFNGAYGSGALTVSDSTIDGNTAGSGGGISNGAFNVSNTLVVVNTTIADNTAYSHGGGIFNAGTLTAANTTIAYNQSSYYSGPGMYDNPGCITTLDNTIVAVNTGGGSPDDIDGAPASVVGQYDLVGVDDTGSLSNGTNGNLVTGTANPGLGLLAYNGGPTQTIVLRPGSPAIDAGSNALANEYSLTTDQRGAGFPRIVDGVVDIGAYERAAPSSTSLVSSPNPSVYGQTITVTATVTAGSPPTIYTVNSTGSGSSGTGTSGTLPYVISQANINPNLAGSVIQFASAVFSASNPQTIALTSTVNLGGPSGPLVIDGPGAGAVTISGGGAIEVFLAEPGAVTTLSGLTISGGSSQGNGGGISVDYDSTVLISNSTIEGNSAAPGGYVGGGIYNNGSLTVNDTMISGNSASQGGGIFSDSLGTLTVTGGSTIEGNTGGGIINNGSTLTVIGSTIEGNTGSGIATGGTTTITDSTIEDNAITGGGCCAYGAGISAGGTLTITDSTIAGNTSANAGGAGLAVFGTATITGSTFEGNILAGAGGGSGAAIYNAGTLTVADSTIDGNSDLDGEGDGGGIDTVGVATVIDCTIDDNFALGGGGGVGNGGTLSIIDSTIAGNAEPGSQNGGGGILNYGTATVSGSTIMDNSAGGAGEVVPTGGGGILNRGTFTVTDSTITGNSAGAYSGGGGGIVNFATLTAVNTTIAYNYTGNIYATGGGMYDYSGTTTLYNTIVAANTADDGADDIVGAIATSSSNNLVGVDETGSVSSSFNPIVIGAANPGLGLPAYNGGPTQTIALLAGSPAIDAGSNALANEYSLNTDQRGPGFPRTVNGTVDIGAFERHLASSIGPATVYTVDLTSDTGASTGADAGDLAYVIGQANLNPNLAGSVIEFDPTVFSASNPQTITLTSTLELAGPSGPMEIDGPGASVVTISGGNAVGVFQAEPGAVTTLSGVTISGGSAVNGGGIDVSYDGTVTVIDCTITNNSASYSSAYGGGGGGGIDNDGYLTVTDSTIEHNSGPTLGGGISNYGTLTVSGSAITGNFAFAFGGGIFADGTTQTITGCTIQQNTITGEPYGGGGAGIADAFGVATVTDCAITDNSAGGASGAGIFNYEESTMTVAGCTIAANSGSGGVGISNEAAMTVTGSTIEDNTVDDAYGSGGGIGNGGTMSLSGSTVEDNSARMNTNSSGGGVQNSGTLTVTECAISDNSAGLGGGIYSEGSCTVTDTSIAGNSAIYGGGIECSGTTAITRSMISGNTVLYGGGGIYNGGALIVTDCAITDNSAIYAGGGIVNDGTLTVTNSSIADNQCGYIPMPNPPGGGGILNYGTWTAVNTTIAYNTAYGYGGGAYDYPGSTTTLYNTIVALNATTIDGADDIAGAGVSSASAYNLVGVDETGSLTSGADGNLVIGATNPGLGLPALNGGPTQTIALLAGSPAIDAGSNALASEYSLTTDQRGAGFPRIVNGTVDIGAFERPLAASIGPATVYTVDLTSDTGASTSADAGDLAYCIGQADVNPNLAGSVIQFDPTVFSVSNPKTILLTSTLELGGPSGPMVIDGPGAGAVTISGGNAVGVFQVAPGAVVTLSGLTISGGSGAGNVVNGNDAGGVDVPYGGTLTVAGCTITGNSSYYGGGGIYNDGTLTVTGCTITDNTGGGIYGDGNGTMTVSDSTIEDNSSGWGGGIGSDGGTLTVTRSTIEGNTGSSGGGIWTNNGTVTVTGSTIEDNVSTGGGGGIWTDGGTVTVSGSTIVYNTAAGGGGISASEGLVTVTESTIAHNSASSGDGGGIGNGGTMTIVGSAIENNMATGSVGGGIANGGTMTVSDSTIKDNSLNGASQDYGGGIFNQGALTLTGCTISGNSAGGIDGWYGGGIDNLGTATVTGCAITGNVAGADGGIDNGGTLTVINSTIAGNSTEANGAGIVNGGVLTAVNTTIAYNDGGFNYYGGSGVGAGIYVFPGATTTLYNTIVAANTADDGADDIGGAGVSSASAYNLVGVDNTGSLTYGTDGNLVGVTNPGLASRLANNGGPTQTIALLAGSPAIDAGNNALAVDPTTSQPLTTDQRGAGYPRIVNGTVDIGAFEVQAGPVTTTTTTISPLANPPVFGQSLTFTATVAPTIGSGTPAGTVQFLIDGSDFGSPVPLVGGSATSAAVSSLSVASHAIEAVYSGAANFGTSTGTLSQTVNPDSTTTSFAVSMSTSDLGQSVAFTANVTANAPGAGTPAGTVQFLIDGSDFGSPVTLEGGSATSAGISSLSVASHTIQAVYSGGTDFLTSTGTLTETVAQHGTTTSVVSSASPSSAGQSVTFTATVAAIAPGSCTPAGTVQFLIDGSDFGRPVTLVDGSATSAAISSLSVASHAIEAVYCGAANFGSSTGTLSQTVNPDSTTTSFAVSMSTSDPGQTVSFMASVVANAPGSGTPGGTVQFLIDGSDFGSPVTLVDGRATSAGISSLTVATHTIEAVYSGGTDFTTSTGTMTDTVGQHGTTTSVVSSASPSSAGQSVTFTATVAPNTAGSGTPTGTVQFLIDGSDFGSPMALVAGSATSAAISSLTVATHTIEAVYSGNSDFAVGTGTLTQTVDPANTSSASPSVPPTGTVIYYAGAVSPADEIGTGTLSTSPSGVTTATFSTHSLPAGAYAITAVYGGDTNYPQSTSNVVSQVVNPAPLVISAKNQSKVYGQANPALTVSYSGFVNGDTSAELTTLPTVTTTATTTSPVGSYAITASGAVDPNYTISYVAGTLTISPDATTTVASASTTSTGFGQPVTLSATVTANAPGSGTPAGSVDFLDTTTGDDLGSVALSGGKASLSTSSLPLGANSIKVSYSDTADSNFLASSTTISTITINQSIIVLDPTAGGALSLSGNASIKLTGGVFVDSSSSTAISASGNAAVKASVIDVHGGVQKSGNASFSPAPTTGAAVLADPLALVAEPSTSSLTSYGSESVSGNSSATIKPGIYSQISVSGNGTLTMNSGIYIIEGGGFSVSGNASVSGSGVMIFSAGSKYPTTGGTYGGITLSGNGSYNLSPPTSGTYAGIVIFQSRDNATALTLSGNASGMTGTIYAKAAQLAESGNAQLNAAVVADTMTISGNGVSNTVALSSPAGTAAYTPAQIRAAYGISALPLDGTGQTIAVVDAYDDPSIFQALDAFDAQFGLTPSGSTLYAQYGPASSFLRVLNQDGQATSLPSTDPNGPGTDNWELEEALDVEWAHALAPGAQIILVEADSQSLSDLMASVATAAHQPGVSVVSMSWGFPEGQAVFAADEAAYDGVFNVPGVTFVASTGDYGAADPEYPAFSPNVVAVGGTSLTLNADGSYDGETGWGYQSDSIGAFIGSGGGISLYEPEPAYQQGVQSTGSRTTPDVSLVADPATGAWIADPYNLDPSNPFEIVGGTSLSAPAWAGLVALVNQGRAAVSESSLNGSSPTDTQQALYMLPQSDYNTITSGINGYTATAGYNLVTGLGTPVANLLVPDLVAYQGPGTTYSGPSVGPLQDAGLVSTGTTDSEPMDEFSVFDSFTVASVGLSHVSAQRSNRVETTLSHGTNPVGRAARLASVWGDVVDQVLDAVPNTDSHDTLIGDLAFEQVSSGIRKPRGSAAIGTTG